MADPPLHRLDGRRRLAVEARVRVPAVQLRRRHPVDRRARSRGSISPRATARRSTSSCGRATSAASVTTPGTPRSCCPAASTARCGCPIRPAARRTSSDALDAIVEGFTPTVTDEAYDSVPGLDVALDDGVLRLTLRPARQAQRPRRRHGARRSSTRSRPPGRDEAVRVVVIAGAGDHFCSGVDIVARNAATGDRKPRAGSIQRRLPSQAHRLIPLHGHRAGARGVRGAGLGGRHRPAPRRWPPTSRSPPRMPASGSRSRQRGFTPDSGGTWLLPRLVGEVRAREMLLLGPCVSGTEAAEWGLIHRAVAADELASATEELVAQLASGPDGHPRPDEVAAATPGSHGRSRITSATRRSRWRSPRGARTSARGWRRSPGSAPPSSEAAERDRARRGDRRLHRPPRRQPSRGPGSRPYVPVGWRTAAAAGGAAAIREVRTRADYEAWYPVFGRSGLVAPTWPVEYGGLDSPRGRPRDRSRAARPTTSAGSTRWG